MERWLFKARISVRKRRRSGEREASVSSMAPELFENPASRPPVAFVGHDGHDAHDAHDAHGAVLELERPLLF